MTVQFQNVRDVEKVVSDMQTTITNQELAINDLRAALNARQEAEAAKRMVRASGPSDAVGDFVLNVETDANFIRSAPRGSMLQVPGTPHVIQLRTHTSNDRGTSAGLLDADPCNEWHEEFQSVATDRAFIRAFQRSPHTPMMDAKVARCLKRAPDAIRDVINSASSPDGFISRIFSDSSGIGAETIFDGNMPTLERTLDLYRGLPSIFQEVQMSSPTVNIPFLASGLRPYITGGAPGMDDPARISSSSATYESRQINSAKMAVRMQADTDATEDAFFDFLGEGMRLLTEGILFGEEDVIINGDTNSTHQDAIASWNTRGLWGSASAGSLDHRKHSIGLRARAFDVSNTTDRTAAQTVAGARLDRSLLGSPYGLGKCAWITSYEYFLKKLVTDDDFKKLSDFGGNQTVINGNISGPMPGQVGVIDGIPVLVSWFMTADLANTGLYTGSGALSGQIFVNTDRFRRYVRRGRRIEADRDIARQTSEWVATYSWKFQTIDASATKNVHYAFNLLS